MVAFTILGHPIYRYGLFYLASFVSGYIILTWLGRSGVFSSYTQLQRLLTDKVDDLMLVALAGVIVGGRLGHVFLYDAVYYLQNPGQIYLVQQGGMSFVGGVIGVVIGLLRLTRAMKLSKKELYLLGDIILCIVPIGVLLGRIGNLLNQELRGRPIQELAQRQQSLWTSLGLTHVYDQVDEQIRVNTNLIQSFAEGFLPIVSGWYIMLTQYLKKKIQPGLISGIFFIIYGIVRFLVEFVKDLPAQEMLWGISVSQWMMFVFIGVGIYLIQTRFQEK